MGKRLRFSALIGVLLIVFGLALDALLLHSAYLQHARPVPTRRVSPDAQPELALIFGLGFGAMLIGGGLYLVRRKPSHR